MQEIQFDEEKHIYSYNGVIIPGVTEILSPITAGGYSKINPAVLEHAAMKGTLVHEWCEMYDYDSADDVVPSELAPYCMAYADFIRDYRPEWEKIEEIVAHLYTLNNGDGDLEFDYCGRLDRYGVIDGEKSVMDIKTISSPSTKTHISVCCQTSAYAWAIDETDFGNIGRYALYLKPDGTYKLFDCREYEKKNGFIGLELFYLLKRANLEINRIGRRKK